MALELLSLKILLLLRRSTRSTSRSSRNAGTGSVIFTRETQLVYRGAERGQKKLEPQSIPEQQAFIQTPKTENIQHPAPSATKTMSRHRHTTHQTNPGPAGGGINTSAIYSKTARTGLDMSSIGIMFYWTPPLPICWCRRTRDPTGRDRSRRYVLHVHCSSLHDGAALNVALWTTEEKETHTSPMCFCKSVNHWQ